MYLNKNILKNIYTLSSAQALLLVIPIILISILLRTVGLEGFGYYSLAQGFSALVFIIVEAGNDIFFTSRLANDEKKLTDSQNSYISAAYIVKIATSVLILVLLLLILNLWSNSVADYKVLWISAWILGFTQGFSLNWLFHAKKMFLLPALVDVLAKLMAIGACILFVTGINKLHLIFLFQGIVYMMGFVLLYYVAIKQNQLKITIKNAKVREYIRFGLSGMFIKIINYLVSFTPLYMGGLLLNANALGSFAVADRLLKVTRIALAVVNKVYYPRISAMHKSNKTLMLVLLKTNFKINIMISFGIIALFALVPEGNFLYLIGVDESRTYKDTMIMLFALPLLTINTVLGVQWFYNIGNGRCTALTLTVGLLVIVVSILFVPIIDDIFRLIGSVLLSELIMAMVFLFLLIKSRNTYIPCLPQKD